MFHVLLLIAVFFFLLYAVRKMVTGEKYNPETTLAEAKQIARSMLLGIVIVISLIVIAYEAWVLSGRSADWDGVYITAAAITGTAAFSFGYYYRVKSKYT
ncbi:hypothetical protein [Peribacillus frigoritolerans]|uniref:hypothetical protein n=1 Tax=Peribacillus frigoritolerans TaxID=450367 RepID=UPI00105987C1|nr:hypothetical protein [Peribacillus frigoritolerans]TDL82410.1 hypothetical protein E2R53_02205 [Peribacillus frigoritolerans]